MFVRRSLPFVLALTLLLAVVLLGARPRGQRLTFLAVGQGDCTVWQDDQVTILIDVGPKSPQGYDAGQRIVLPKLRKMNIRSIDFILITHPDSDHIGGLEAVRKKYPAAKVVASNAFQKHPEMRRWLQSAGMRTTDVMWVSGKSKLTLPHSVVLIAAPELMPSSSDNEGSLFVRIVSERSAAVLTGDAGMETEAVMQRHLAWSGQILKAGHHGSRTSTSEGFVKAVKPKWAVISCGRDNPFGHPHRSVMEMLESQRVQILRTDRDGDLAFQPGSEGFVPFGR